jgi:phosphatidylinositol dimannoside acyltransferase
VNAAATPRPGRSLRSAVLLGGARVLAALPEAPLVAACESIGELWYRLAPAKAAQARANLRRVCEGLAAQGRGPARARRAATDDAALERLVRACFRHATRYYLEVARTGGYDIATAVAKVDLETRGDILEAFDSGRHVIIVGMHFAAVELPAMYIAHLLGHQVTAPMEFVADPALQQWFVESRARVGVDVVPLADARRPLMRALREGRSIGLVADRDLTGTGLAVPFFGHDAPVSPAPALFAIETGVPIYAGSARRLKGGHYGGKVWPVPTPEEGTRRERVTELTRRIAESFETILADAPEQWWGAFHPIWPDLVVGGAPAAAQDGAQDGTPAAAQDGDPS